ncbi:MAG: hydrogenase maturation nickel metallochaperone HypA [Ammonifex sp.]|nr:MAG: hydrogenase maturation nickel metallochaperone HypA [Ammonifex sp.]
MHEFSLVESMIELVKQSAAENHITRVTSVKLIVGKLIMAQPELLRFSFDVLSGGTILEGATLEIEERPLLMRCQGCGNEYAPDFFEVVCPECTGIGEVLSGKELHIEHYEGDSGEDDDGVEGGNGATPPAG